MNLKEVYTHAHGKEVIPQLRVSPSTLGFKKDCAEINLTPAIERVLHWGFESEM